MIEVIKRDGKIVDFNLSKISGAMEKAFKATGTEYTNDILELLSLRVTAAFQEKIADGKIGVEDIQDCVEQVLRVQCVTVEH